MNICTAYKSVTECCSDDLVLSGFSHLVGDKTHSLERRANNGGSHQGRGQGKGRNMQREQRQRRLETYVEGQGGNSEVHFLADPKL